MYTTETVYFRTVALPGNHTPGPLSMAHISDARMLGTHPRSYASGEENAKIIHMSNFKQETEKNHQL